MVALANYSPQDFRNEKAAEQARLDQMLAQMVPREIKDEDVSPDVYNRVRVAAPTSGDE